MFSRLNRCQEGYAKMENCPDGRQGRKRDPMCREGKSFEMNGYGSSKSETFKRPHTPPPKKRQQRNGFRKNTEETIMHTTTNSRTDSECQGGHAVFDSPVVREGKSFGMNGYENSKSETFKRPHTPTPKKRQQQIRAGFRKNTEETNMHITTGNECQGDHGATVFDSPMAKKVKKDPPEKAEHIDMYHRSRKNCRRLKQSVFITSTIWFIFHSVTICNVILLWKRSSDNQMEMHDRDTKNNSLYDFCIPCSRFKFSPSQEDELSALFQIQIKNNQKLCCATSADQLADLLYMVARRYLREEKAKGTLCKAQYFLNGTSLNASYRRPAAHVIGTIQSQRTLLQSNSDEQNNEIKTWQHHGGQAFQKNGVEYRNGRLVVPETGLYHVYSHIYFVHVYSRNTDEKLTDSTLFHSVHKYNLVYRYSSYDGAAVLFQNAESKCWAKNKTFWDHSSYLGGLAYLKAQDEIFIKVSNLTMANRNPRASYFGLYLVS